MPTKNNLHLKGYVGGYDFDRDFVDYILGKNAGKPVNVLIDGLEHRTDAFHTLYIGCEKFPYREAYSVSTTEIL
jgi:hypothetical protein